MKQPQLNSHENQLLSHLAPQARKEIKSCLLMLKKESNNPQKGIFFRWMQDSETSTPSEPKTNLARSMSYDNVQKLDKISEKYLGHIFDNQTTFQSAIDAFLAYAEKAENKQTLSLKAR